ncbi:MAG TPA: hypothetical protein VKV35_12540 [Streptosporangiaceae bacterium]|nr:hypothetical protein [Streptosporangiaceae bacterium]
MPKPGKLIVLVTGTPGTRKTALARDLSAALKRPMSGAYVIESALFDSLNPQSCACSSYLRKASVHAMWRLLSESPTGAVVEIGDDADAVAEGLSRIGEYRLAEIFCNMPPATGDGGSGPLGLGPSRYVDLSQPVDTEALVTWILCRACRN